MIVRTTDWRALVDQCVWSDLMTWHPSVSELDWPAMLGQPGWHLITDQAGSWCLLEPVGSATMAHLIIDREQRGKMGLEIARKMLTWISQQGITSLVATTSELKTRLFLRWLGFRPDPVYPSVMVLILKSS